MNGGPRYHSVLADNLVEPPVDQSALRGDVKILGAGSVRYRGAAVTCAILDDRSELRRGFRSRLAQYGGGRSVGCLVETAEYRAAPRVRGYVLPEQGRMGAMAIPGCP